MQSKETITATGLTDLMHQYVSANLWANRRYVNWLKAKSPELLNKTIPSSFPSIKATLIHIWDTERFWLSMLQQTPPPVSFRINGFNGTLEDVFTGMVQQSGALEKYVHSLDETSILEMRKLDSPWAKGIRPQYHFIQHCVNHSTYHRGQVVTIGHNVGIKDAPMTDYNAYLITSSSLTPGSA